MAVAPGSEKTRGVCSLVRGKARRREVLMPPLAFTWAVPSTASSISSTAQGVAPPGPKPVDVFTKSTPQSTHNRQASTIWPGW